MYKLRYKLKIDEKIAARCPKHPKYDPVQEGREGIKARCSTCTAIFDLFESKLKLDRVANDFIKRAVPWIKYPTAKSPASAIVGEDTTNVDVSG